jgi:hypothetical protein
MAVPLMAGNSISEGSLNEALGEVPVDWIWGGEDRRVVYVQPHVMCTLRKV